MSRRSFKTDSSFLEKISCGAVGTLKVIERLEADGHKPIELERGSTSFKIWKKIAHATLINLIKEGKVDIDHENSDVKITDKGREYLGTH